MISKHRVAVVESAEKDPCGCFMASEVTGDAADATIKAFHGDSAHVLIHSRRQLVFMSVCMYKTDLATSKKGIKYVNANVMRIMLRSVTCV